MKSTSILALLAAVAFVKIGATTSSLPYEVDAGASEGDKEHQGNRLVPRQVSPPPAPTASGTSTSCDLWYTVTAADPLACKNAMTYGTLSLEKFLALNPAVNSNCTNLWIGYAYCIGGAVLGNVVVTSDDDEHDDEHDHEHDDEDDPNDDLIVGVGPV
ncbi:hypothetical protein MMC16_005305 [Acarospora aff. strigata]|nr:hypothetical protein [Acarospora aff. strigata]